MFNFMRKISLLLGIMLVSIFSLVGCDNGKGVENTISTYVDSLNKGEYEKFYDLLSAESKELYQKDEFVERYTNIYNSIGVKNMKVEIGEVEDISNIPVSISMDTIAGNIKYDNLEINVVKEDKEYKIVWDESLILPPMIKDDKVRYETQKASRGQILDRDGNVLAADGDVNVVNIHPSVFETNKEENIKNLATILDISESVISDKLEKNQNPEHRVPIVKVSNYNTEVLQQALAIEGVKATTEKSRVYVQGESFGSLIGHVGDITKEELDKNKDKGYSQYSKIGKSGLEKEYEEKLKAKDGIHIYIERGEENITIAKSEPQNGQDIKLSIDSQLQNDIYAQMNNEKGASVAIHPKTGEVLAMVSSPSYDSNTLVTYTTKTTKAKWEQNGVKIGTNNANDAYSPGSTMKLITAAIGLEEGIIDPNQAVDINGLTWKKDSSWGDYNVTRVKDPNKPVNLYDATKYSDNIYFAQKAIEIGEEKFLSGLKDFGIGEEVPFEYPMAKSQVSNDKKLSSEILLGDSGYGQGEVLMTPLDVAMAYSALGNDGKIMTPRLVISENKDPKVYKEAINTNHIDELVKCFTGVVNDSDGSANNGKIDGIEILGKTGTAEIKASKEDTSGTENGWFVAMNTNNPEIAVSMIIEDVKDKGSSGYVVPKVSNSIKNYLSR